MAAPKKIELAKVEQGHYRATVPLHAIQIAFRNSKALYRGCVAGRGAGKSYVGAYDMIRRSLPGRHYLVASPTGQMMADTTFPTFKAIAEAMGVWPTNRRKIRLSPYPTIELKNGAEIRFRSADNPERMRGPNLSGAWLDEGSQMEEAAFEITIAALREAGELGWLSCTFTPKGMSHWTYRRFGEASEDTELFHCPTKANPFLHKDQAATLARHYVGAWAQQELDGLFVSMEGAEFDPAWFGPEIWVDHFPPRHEILLTVLALDPSKGRDARSGKEGKLGDYSAFVVMMLHKDGTIYIDADLDQRRTSVKIVEDGIALYLKYRPDCFAIETAAWQDLLAAEFLRVAGEVKPPIILPVYGIPTGGVAKEVRIRRLAPILSGVDGRCRFISENVRPGERAKKAGLLVAQLREFRAPPHPPEYHDDGPDAMEMGLRMLLHRLHGAPAGDLGQPKPLGR